MSEFEGKVPIIKIAECKYISKCEMIVTGLKYNKFYFEHFFTALSVKDRKE